MMCNIWKIIFVSKDKGIIAKKERMILMKKTGLLAVILAGVLLTSCGTADDTDSRTESRAAGMAGSTQSGSDSGETHPRYEFSETLHEELSDEEIKELALAENWSNREMIDGYFYPETDGEVELVIVPEEAEDFDAYCADPANIAPNCTAAPELAEDNELYLLYRADKLYLVPKNFRYVDNGYVRYLGEMDEESVLKNFDLIAGDKRMLCRRLRDDAEIKCLSYDFWDIRVENGEALLYWRCFLPDREDRMFSLEPEWNIGKTVTLDGGSPEPDSSSADGQEITDSIDSQSAGVMLMSNISYNTEPGNKAEFFAEPWGDEVPEWIELCVNVDGQESVIGKFSDSGDEESGDSIGGDGLWTCTLDSSALPQGDVTFTAKAFIGGAEFVSEEVEINITPDSQPSEENSMVQEEMTRLRSSSDYIAMTKEEREAVVEESMTVYRDEGLVTDWHEVETDIEAYIEYTFPDGSKGSITVGGYIIEEEKLNFEG